MSDKDLVARAALQALSRPTIANAPTDGESSKTALSASSSKTAEKSKIPEKGSAEAAVHNLAAKAAAEKSSTAIPKSGSDSDQGSGLGFLFLVLALPLAVVGGLYGYAHMQENTDKSGKNTLTAANTPKGQPHASRKEASATALEKGFKNPLMEKSASNHSKSASAKDHDKAKAPASNAKSASSAKTTAAKIATGATSTPKTEHAAKTDAKNHNLHWDYKSTDWAKIDPSFKTCGEGSAQSPINIVAGNGQAGPGFQYNYYPSSGKVHNNGHSIQVDLQNSDKTRGNQLLVNGEAYDLIQFHFHTPSENHINGRQFPMEVHLVHKNAHGQLAVVAIMISAGNSNQLLDRMPVPANKGDFSKSGGAHINPALLLPNDRRTYTFSGSLTTPPCSQNVGWIVMKQPITVSLATLAKFQKVLGKNNRPLQPANDRTIFSGY